MEIRGLSQGLSVFYIEARIMYRTEDGYDGVETFPTFWTVGGTPEDAIKNAEKILKPRTQIPKSSQFVNFSIFAVNADVDSEYRSVIRCAHRFCNTCSLSEGVAHTDMAHEFNHTCIDNICNEYRN